MPSRAGIRVAAGVFLSVLAAVALAQPCDCGMDANGNCAACAGPPPNGGGSNRGHPGVVPRLPYYGPTVDVDVVWGGPYTRTCAPVPTIVEGPNKHITITTRCRAMDGTWRTTTLNAAEQCFHGTIENVNGALHCDKGGLPPGGSYRQSCTPVWIEGGDLHGLCRRSDGSWRESALRNFGGCRDVTNLEGILTCR